MGVRVLTKKTVLGFCLLLIILFALIHIQPNIEYEPQINEISLSQSGYERSIIEKWWSLRNSSKKLSNLGRILYLNENPPEIKTDKKYQILVWKYGKTIENRHLKQFTDKEINPFENCSVKNCDITYNDAAIKTANIVIFHLHRFKGISDLPTQRTPNQIWAFLTDESPHHTFMKSNVKLSEFNGIFNWSMTYRMDSDIPVPYGRTILQNQDSLDLVLSKRRDVLVAILGSNCGGKSHRWDYVQELKKHIQVDVYGKCGSLKSCPGHFKNDCLDIGHYLFYLSFENSNCDEYITEKLWWNAYSKNSIPIVMGPPRDDYERLLPPNSYINVEDFSSPYSLSQFILRLNQTGEFTDYFKWKKNFRVLNEHGYFHSNSVHYCRICEALNYNSKQEKTYKNLTEFWSTTKNCYAAWNEQ